MKYQLIGQEKRQDLLGNYLTLDKIEFSEDSGNDINNFFRGKVISFDTKYGGGIRKPIPIVLSNSQGEFLYYIRKVDLEQILITEGIQPNGVIPSQLSLIKKGKFYNIVTSEALNNIINNPEPKIDLEYGKRYQNSYDSFVYLGRLKKDKRYIFVHCYSNSPKELFIGYEKSLSQSGIILQKTKKKANKDLGYCIGIPKKEDLIQHILDLKIKKPPKWPIPKIEIILKDEIIL